MKPHIVCHMVSSIDGRVHHSRWRPAFPDAGKLYEAIHEEIGGGTWLVGRVTGQEFAKREAPYPKRDSGENLPRDNHIVRRGAGAYGVVLDAHGKIAWGRSDVGGDPIVVVLTRQVPEDHLAGLREEGVSYVFAGDDRLDLAEAVEVLNAELGIEQLLLEGGGVANGEFLRAGLVDEISLVVCPAVDGARGAPIVFDSTNDADGPSAPIAAMELKECRTLHGGAVWLRYRVTNGD